MGRPSKLTPDVQARFVQAITLGATYEIACKYAGIVIDTYYRWRKMGEERAGPHREFVEALERAEGTAAIGWLAKIEKAASDGAWQPAAWKLERRYPHAYGRTVQEQSGSVNVNHRHFDFSMFTPREQASLDELAERAESGAAS